MITANSHKNSTCTFHGSCYVKELAHVFILKSQRWPLDKTDLAYCFTQFPLYRQIDPDV